MARPRKDLAQFFTPSEVVHFIYELIDFQPGWKVLEPACGDGAFLREAVRRGCGRCIGLDIDPKVIQQANQELPSAEFRCIDALYYSGSDFDLVVGNPPFRNRHRTELTAELKDRLCDAVGLKANRVIPIEGLFLLKSLALVRSGGHVALILPQGIFANSRLRYLREYLIQETTVHAVIQLPRGTFRYTQVQSNILYLTRTPPCDGNHAFLARIERKTPEAFEEIKRAWLSGTRA